ncbi:MAG: hypothetical protein EXS67_02875 [Candidatus Margulisbacteria bacterium]|nr:hypothetical protein [Candidatus Margulisiibacteriota bacterium]
MNIKNVTCFLVDATGVLYNDEGPISGIQKTIQTLQKQGLVIVVTNNSSYYLTYIAKRLQDYEIPIPQSHIISSGQGLQKDPEIQPLIFQKKCFIYGGPNSYQYIEDAGGYPTEKIENAECIVLTSSLKKNNQTTYTLVKNHLLKHPKLPVICCNPDTHVAGKNNTLIPVIGYYAKKLEIDCNLNFIWIGKPFPNFATLVKNHIQTTFGYSLGEHTLFFDDNPENCLAFENQLDIKSCLIKQTGLAQREPWSTFTYPTHTLESLVL